MISSSFSGPAIAVKKSQGIKSIHETTYTSTSFTSSSNDQFHLKGIKLLQIHTKPSSVAVGNTFSLRGIVYNNSSSTITFSNGTCNSALSANFNKNVLTENQRVTSCILTAQKATLKPSERSAVFSGIAYKAIAPGQTNATMIFKYGVQAADGRSAIDDNTSRVYTFDIHKVASTGASTIHAAAHYHIKGVKLLRVHTIPSKVAVGNTFSLGGIVTNNSTATIVFANGTCTTIPPSLYVTFNRNVMTETKTAATPCKPQQVILKPGEKSGILIPNLSRMAYKATFPGITNATMIFNYGVQTATDKSPIIDHISRVYTFNIRGGTHQTAGAAIGTSTTSNSGPLKLPTP